MLRRIMSRLTVETWTMPAAELDGENPLAPLRAYLTASLAAATAVAAGDQDYADKGQESAILPYRLQDRYSRNLSPRRFKTAVLENDLLRATFLLELGGRLWSLYHKPTERELLFVSPAFQPANLAVRDAWFCGGVEWNISIIGHSPFTCSPLFAARVEGEDGAPVLRLYEWDRIRRVPFQLDCWLPEGSPFLFVRARITNPHDQAIPMYWWSNIAVHERPDVRVLGPAGNALRHDYDGQLVAHDIPIYNGVDVTYPSNRPWAADMYFRIPPGQRPWIAALDADGRGLVHASTRRLIGRKVFNWGTSTGGRRWQEFLSRPGHAYIEIQGGLTQTQSEYVAMPAGAEWSWLEAYGPLEANPGPVHGTDWRAAWQEVQRNLDRVLPQQWLESELEWTIPVADRAPEELLHHGSGWGALERRRRAAAGQSPFATAALAFPDESLTDEQAPWLDLIETGHLPSQPAAQPPVSLMVQPEWRDLLEKAVRDKPSQHWLAWYHLGVMRFRAGDHSGARAAWGKSLEQERSAWAMRDLAVLTAEEGDDATAADLWLAAARLAPEVAPLAVECAQALSRAGRWRDQVQFISALPEPVQSHGRLRLLRAQAALELGDLATVRQFFEGDLAIANIREKETVLSDVWFGWQEKRLAKELGAPIDDALRRRVREEFPPPMRFDFRMSNRQP
jgi:hypothetical protein